MSAITRRFLLAGVALAPATAVPSLAAAPERPWDKATRLATELSGALDQVDKARWFAKVCPASVERHAIYFGRTDAVEEPEQDPLLEAIISFRAALDDFCRNAPDDDEASDAYAQATFMPTKRVLDNWDRSAATKKAAVEALRLASEELDQFERSAMVAPLVNAALAYFEGRA